MASPSTDAPSHGYAEQQLVADAVAVLDALGLNRGHLAGLDVGGILGFRLCLPHPERVRRFVCLAAPHPYPAFSARVLLETWRLWPRFRHRPPAAGAAPPWPRAAGPSEADDGR